jgi:hypothetical protein
MNILEEIKKIGQEISAEIKEEKGIYVLESVIAERKWFLSKKKLTYTAKFRIDEENKLVKFTEMLKESGFGLSSGGGNDFEMSSGFGFKAGTYKMGMDGREGSIEEQSNLFGQKYEYKFDFGNVRKKIEEKSKEAGYQFKYQITSLGL